jgi:hypothetical protein
MTEAADAHEIHAILKKLSGGTIKRKRKDIRTNPLVVYVRALLQPHVVSQTTCELPFKLVSQYDGMDIYDVAGNPPIRNLIVHIKNNAIVHYEFD